MTITIAAMKWAPAFAAGNVRDHRVRWILNEVGWPYEVRLIDAVDLASKTYRDRQPFGQVPYMEEDGRPTLFETGAIVLDVATRSKQLIPDEDGDRSLVVTWLIAALNSVEPPLMNVAEVEYFLDDEQQKRERRPLVTHAANQRIEQLEKVLGDREYLVGDSFTIADLMMSSVLKIASNLAMLSRFPCLLDYHDRCLARQAYRKAVADQRATIAAHTAADMKYEEARRNNV